MKRSVSSLICVGQFCGPDIEEGTFHQEEPAVHIHHNFGVPPCPCPPIEFHGVAPKEPDDDSKKDVEKS